MSPGTGAVRAFVDTNVLVYMFDPDAAAKQTRARDLIIDHLGSGSLCLSTQVLLEFFWAATRKPEIPLPPRVAAGFVRRLLAAHVAVPSPELVLAASERCSEASLSIWDALILTTAESCGAHILYTEDRHLLQASAEVEIVDPFAGLGEPGLE